MINPPRFLGGWVLVAKIEEEGEDWSVELVEVNEDGISIFAGLGIGDAAGDFEVADLKGDGLSDLDCSEYLGFGAHYKGID